MGSEMCIRDRKEEGPHVLAVTVTYKETQPGSETSRMRSFRKLYQFTAQQALGVRTKAGELQGTQRGGGGGGGDRGRQFVLEAQIENLTEQSVLLERVWLTLGRALKSRQLISGDAGGDKVLLAPQDVEQVAFKLEQKDEEGEIEENAGRFVLAQLTVDWRLAMGQDGVLKTGWLGCRKK